MAKIPMTVSVPEGEDHGLRQMALDAISAPRRLHVALVVYDCAEIKQDLDSGALIPKLRAIRLLPLSDVELAQAQDIYDAVDVALNGSRIHEREYGQVKRIEDAFTNPYKVTDEGEHIPYWDKRFTKVNGAMFYETAQPILTWRFEGMVAEHERQIRGDVDDNEEVSGVVQDEEIENIEGIEVPETSEDIDSFEEEPPKEE